MQLWRDSKIQAELVAGYKAWMVIDDVRKMIENEDWSVNIFFSFLWLWNSFNSE